MADKVTKEELVPEYPDPIPGFDDFGHIELEGVANCRDLGGLPAADGRRVNKGRLIRSAELHSATKEDMRVLVEEHGLARVVDFRTAFEIGREEDPIPEMEGIEYVNLRPISNESELTGGEDGKLATIKRLAEDTIGVFEQMYKDMVSTPEGIKVYSHFLEMLLDAKEGATLWHCTQGKDRTGLAAIFVERALGASMEVIQADYLATNLFSKTFRKQLQSLIQDIPLVGQLDIDLDAATYVYMRNLNCAFGVIDKTYGSLDSFLDKALDFGPEKQQKLQEMYLEH